MSPNALDEYIGETEDKYMTNYEQYEAVLKNRAILYVVFVIITLIGIGLLIYFFNSKKEIFWKNMKKNRDCMYQCFCCYCCFLSVNIYNQICL